MMFAKMKAQLRAAAIRIVDALWQAVGTIALTLPAAETEAIWGSAHVAPPNPLTRFQCREP